MDEWCGSYQEPEDSEHKFEECFTCEGPNDADGCPLSFPELDCLKISTPKVQNDV